MSVVRRHSVIPIPTAEAYDADENVHVAVGIVATGPICSGSAASLEQVIQVSDMGVMGDTSMLSEERQICVMAKMFGKLIRKCASTSGL